MRELLERAFDVDASACRLARQVVTACLHEHVGRPALEVARLLVTELVANAVRHSGAYADESIVVRVWLGADDVRLEVDDPGRGGAVRLRPPSFQAGGGLGLNLVDVLSERWAAEHVPGARTRVWADVGRATAFATGPFPEIERDVHAPDPRRRPRLDGDEAEKAMTDRSDDGPGTAHAASSGGAEPQPHDAPQDRTERTPPGRRREPHLERAHRTVSGMSEALPGAPRSGSA